MLDQNPAASDQGVFDFDFLDGNLNWLDSDFTNFPLPQIPLSGEQYIETAPRTNHAGTLLHNGPGQLQSIHEGSQTNTESPRSVFSSAITDSTTPQSISDGRPSEVGEYYVDGEPARLPRVKRRKTSTSRHVTVPPDLSIFSLDTSFSIEWQTTTFGIHPSTYAKLQTLYQRLCLEAPAPWQSFAAVTFPGKDFLEQLIRLYLGHFDQILPFLHHSQREEAGQNELLVLAMAAIGSHYLGESASQTFTGSIHEFARRCLLYRREELGVKDDSGIFIMAAELLHLLGLAYAGDDRSRQWALSNRSQLQTIFKSSKAEAARCLHNAVNDAPTSHPAITLQRLHAESHTRLAYCAWLVDCMLSYHFQYSPCLSLRDATLPLPCHERLWFSNEGTENEPAMSEMPRQPSLNEALQELYIDKRLPRERGEFARILLIHGLFHRMWDVENYFSDPLSHWQPSAGRHSSAELLPTAPIFLPTVQTFAKWQNSACDCLDVLHWEANATIGQSRGLEHPTVLHLHFARIVLLTPYSEIVSLARLMTGNSSSPASSEKILSKKQLIQKWAIQHQYKARLAIIHAGVTFWHVRRYTIDAFYEGPAVALAALVLWAFGTFTSKKALGSRSASAAPNSEQRNQLQQQQQPPQEDSDQSEEAMCAIILLDRPTDDELVQQFIRNGHSMQAHLTGVGDLYSPKGPERALSQGCRLLSSLRCWGVGASWLTLLQDLVGVLHRQNVPQA